MPQISAVMMNPEFFPDPERFDPYRFLEADGRTMKKVDQLIPFSLGKRKCLGESLAGMELFLIFTTLLQRFKFEPTDPDNLPSLEGLFGVTKTTQPYKMLVTYR